MMNMYWLIFSTCIMTVMLFYFSTDLVLNLVCLLFFVILASFLNYLMTNEFWGLGLMIIVMATGLFLVFAYIVSVNPQLPTGVLGLNLKSLFLISLSIFVYFMIYSTQPEVGLIYEFFFPLSKEIDMNYKSSFLVSLHLIVLLLFLVIFFMRFTYSKGGGLRKKF
uniref:NADH dehydrogenase subunit 6 n=1 Tax=Colpocephalum griffoneae TaxID=2358484 RepID=A0A386B2E3_9NEOP|nr:NADH dehydrogenase subunit 6 [Colpocephalum griffoneae]AYC65901.1 NADH dehydrogenase subunit 6 [Colpocephalum griffoneae]